MPYEFGVKVTVATTLKEGLGVGVLVERAPKMVIVDRG